MRGVRHLATENPAVFFENRDDQRAAVFAEACLEVGLLVFEMILLGKDQDKGALIGKLFTGPRRDEGEFRRLAVPLERAADRGFHRPGRLYRRFRGGFGPQRDVPVEIKRRLEW